MADVSLPQERDEIYYRVTFRRDGNQYPLFRNGLSAERLPGVLDELRKRGNITVEKIEKVGVRTFVEVQDATSEFLEKEPEADKTLRDWATAAYEAGVQDARANVAKYTLLCKGGSILTYSEILTLDRTEDVLREFSAHVLEQAATMLDRKALGGTAYNAAANDVRSLKGEFLPQEGA